MSFRPIAIALYIPPTYSTYRTYRTWGRKSCRTIHHLPTRLPPGTWPLCRRIPTKYNVLSGIPQNWGKESRGDGRALVNPNKCKGRKRREWETTTTAVLLYYSTTRNTRKRAEKRRKNWNALSESYFIISKGWQTLSVSAVLSLAISLSLLFPSWITLCTRFRSVSFRLPPAIDRHAGSQEKRETWGFWGDQNSSAKLLPHHCKQSPTTTGTTTAQTSVESKKKCLLHNPTPHPSPQIGSPASCLQTDR